jgi:CHAT domain-containing protein
MFVKKTTQAKDMLLHQINLCSGVSLLLFVVLFFNGHQRVLADWEEILKSKDPVAESAPKKRDWTYGLQINTTAKIESSSQTEWQDLLLKDDRKKEAAANHNPKIKDLIDQMAEVDAQLLDSSEEKSTKISDFGLVFAELGDFERAQQCCLRAFKLAERNSCENSQQALECMANLAQLFLAIGDLDRAQLVLEDGLKTTENETDMAKRYRTIFLAQLSEVQIERGLFKSAEQNMNLALDNSKNPGTKPSASDARALGAAAKFYRAGGDISKSEELLRNQLSIYEKIPPAGANATFLKGLLPVAQDIAQLNLYEALIAQGKLQDAKSIEPKVESFLQNKAGIFTPSLAFFLRSKAVLDHELGNKAEATASARKYLDYVSGTLDGALSMVESQRLGWQKNYLSFSLPAVFCAPEELAGYVIKWKGIVLDSLIGDRANLGKNNTETAIAINKELSTQRQSLLQANMSGADAAQIQTLKNSIFHLETRLAKETKNFYNAKIGSASLEKVKGALRDNEAVIEFISYKPFPDIRYGNDQVAALIIKKNSPVVWVPIGDSRHINELLLGFQSLIATSNQESAFQKALSGLHSALWKPLEKHLPPTDSHLYISADGFLNFMPFVCLMDQNGALLAEKHSISYIGSGRDLVEASQLPKNKEFRILANPTFEIQQQAGQKAEADYRNDAQDEFKSVALPPLPGTLHEAKELEKVAPTLNWKSHVLLGTEANKLALTNQKPAGILHLATHGFYLGGSSMGSHGSNQRGMKVVGIEKKKIEAQDAPILNPMIQSGIALTGAQTTLNSWSQGRAPDPANDGILTAQDVAGLDLKGTWLVTLSACETGKGEAKSGEGVFGLRRAFMMAGAQNLVMTLWPVSDATTPPFMVEFYKEAMASGHAAAALANTQKNWLTKLRKEKGLVEAVRDIGPFSMVVMANPNIKSKDFALTDMEIKEQKDTKRQQMQEKLPANNNVDNLNKLFE